MESNNRNPTGMPRLGKRWLNYVKFTVLGHKSIRMILGLNVYRIKYYWSLVSRIKTYKNYRILSLTHQSIRKISTH